MKFTEQHPRTIAKVVSWRVLLTISHIVNAFIVTGSILVGLQIAGLAAIINSALFWLHERAWNIAQWNRQSNDAIEFAEGQPRSLSKMITWRVVVTFSNFIIPFILTGSWGQAVLFAGLATAVNMALYWGHERIWNWARWGKKAETDLVNEPAV